MKKQVIAVAVLVCASIPTLASDFYVLADAGQSKFEIDVEGSTLSKTDNVISFGAGYKLNETFAFELAYRDLGGLSEEISEDLGDGDYSTEKYSGSVDALQLSVVASLPLGEAAKLYGRAGFAKLESEEKDSYDVSYNGYFYSESESSSASKQKAVFGVGLSYSFSPSFALRGEYSQYGEWDDVTVSTTTIGLTYQF